jgi:hypothetical protein
VVVIGKPRASEQQPRRAINEDQAVETTSDRKEEEEAPAGWNNVVSRQGRIR